MARRHYLHQINAQKKISDAGAVRSSGIVLVCQAWHNSHGCKSRHGYLPPSVANHKPKTAMSRGRKWGSKVDEPTNRNQI